VGNPTECSISNGRNNRQDYPSSSKIVFLSASQDERNRDGRIFRSPSHLDQPRVGLEEGLEKTIAYFEFAAG